VAKAVTLIEVPTSDSFWFVPGTVTVSGTVNATLPPAGEWRGEGEQVTGPFAVVQVAVQSTPRFAGSPATVAPKLTTPPAGTEAGRGGVMVIPVTVEVMVTIAAKALL
jgi:hypothetical protein